MSKLVTHFGGFPFCLLGFLFNHLWSLQKLRYPPLVLVSHQSVAFKSFVLYVLNHFINLSTNTLNFKVCYILRFHLHDGIYLYCLNCALKLLLC